jgi:hypothetical protein
MTIIQKIKDFLAEIEDISIGYNNLDFCNPDSLDSFQIGYSVDPNGNSLVTGQFGDWEEGWIVIGNDGLGDPIFIDCSSKDLTVFTSQHGEGNWEPTVIADSLDNFRTITKDLKLLSIDRESPVALENNPIQMSDKENFINKISAVNKKSEIWFWELFMEQED